MKNVLRIQGKLKQWRCLLLGACTLLGVGHSALSQDTASKPQAPSTAQMTSGQEQSPGPTATIHVRSHLVVLDVVVTDQKGQIVTGLSADDFRVYENKVQQRIRSFDAHQSRLKDAVVPGIHSTMELDNKEPNAPVSILVLDEINTSFADEAFTRYSLKRYLNSQGDVLLQPTMLLAVSSEHFMVLHDYTNSKSDLLKALDRHLAENPWKAQVPDFQEEQFNAAFAALAQVAQATAGHPGHKNLVWIGKGFPSINMTQLPPDIADALKALIETCTNMMRDSRVTLYTLDSSGVPAREPPTDLDGFYSQDPFGGEINFDTMAAATGGKPFLGRNDLDKLIDSSLQAGANFYTLSYVPPDSDDSRSFRDIQILMKNPELIATTREGYYTGTPPASPSLKDPGKLSDRSIFDLTVAADSRMVYDAVPFSIKQLPGDPGKFEIYIEPQSVPWEVTDPQNKKVEVVLLAESFDKKNKMLNRVVRKITAQSAIGNPDTPSALALTISIPAVPPAVRLRFVVRMDPSGKLGAENLLLVGSGDK